MKKITLADYILLLVIGIMWGSQFALNDIVLKSMSPIFIAASRALIGFVVLSIYTAVCTKNINNKSSSISSVLMLYITIALCEAVLPLFLIAWGVQHVASSIAAILMGTVPIFTVIITAFFLKSHKLNLSTIWGIVIGFLAIVILVAPDLNNHSSSLLGVFAILLGSLSFATSLTLINLLPTLTHPVKHMRNILGIAALILIVVLVSTQSYPLTINLHGIVALTLLGAFCTGLVYAMFIVLIQKTSPVFASTINYLIPIIGVIIGNIFLKEHVSFYESISLLCIFFALYKIKAI